MTIHNESTIIGVFRDRALAEQAVSELQKEGCPADQLKILHKDSGGLLSRMRNILSEQETATTSETIYDDPALFNIPQEHRQYYLRELEAGYFLVTITTQERQQQVYAILHKHGAYDASNVETRVQPGDPPGTQVVQLRKEELQVNKQWVEAGELRIHKKVITEEKTFTIPVMREEIVIERLSTKTQTERPLAQDAGAVPASVTERSATQDTGAAPTSINEDLNTAVNKLLAEGGTLRLLVHEEQVLFEKRPVVVEEVLLHTQVIQDQKQFTEPLKREEASIEQVGNVPLHDNTQDAQPAT